MKTKKEGKTKVGKTSSTSEPLVEIQTKEELKTYLLAIRDKLRDSIAAPVYALTAINHALNLPNIYDLLDGENKELARDIWLRIRQSGMQVKNPPLLFKAEEEENLGATA